MGSPLIWFGNGVKFLKNILRFENEEANLICNDAIGNPDKFGEIYMGPTTVQMYTYDLSDSTLDCSLEVSGLDGKIVTKGSKVDIYYNYASNETALVAGNSRHLFTSVPAGNVLINSGIVGSNFTIANDSGSNFTVEAATSETFNDASTFIIENGQNYQFIAGADDKYTVLQKTSSRFVSDTMTFPGTYGEIRIDDPNDPNLSGYLAVDSTFCEITAFNGNNNDLSTFNGVYSDGKSYQKSANFIYRKEYDSNATALIGGYSRHLFAQDPVGNIGVDYTVVGNNFTVINLAPNPIILEAINTETFNGSSTFTIPKDTTYIFSEGNNGIYGAVLSGDVLHQVDPNNAAQIAMLYLDAPNNSLYLSVEKSGGIVAGFDVVATQAYPEIFMSGAMRYNQAAYFGPTTVLLAGYNKHIFTADPVTSVEMYSGEQGDLTIIGNQSGVPITIIPGGSETFNGASSFVIGGNETYLFINANSGAYKVV